MGREDRALAAAVILLLLPLPCWSWSINTHMYSANLLIEDIRDDGAVQLEEVIRNADGTMTTQKLGDPIPIPSGIAEAILAAPDAFRAGACGPDGYPDIYVGQSVIHPYEPGQPWRSTDWARQVVKKAPDYDDGDFEKQEALSETPRSVSLVLRPRRELGDRAVGILRARSGETEHEVEFLVSLAGGRFMTDPPDPVLKAGDRTTVRLRWEGNGPGSPAAMLSLGKLPPEVWVKADTIRAHEHVAPLKLTGLTLAKAEDARQSLRVIADVPVAPRPERPVLTVDRIARGPVEAPIKGIWLAPGGWADLTVALGTGVPEGTLKLPVKCRIGSLEIQEVITLHVTK